MTNHEIAEWIGLLWALGMLGYIIRIIMCEINK